MRNKIAGMGVVEDELRRKNHELMQGWREKARKLAQTQVLLAHIHHSHNKRPFAKTVQELYDKLKRRTLISQVQQAAADQADQALYMTPHPPSDSRHFQDSLSKSLGNFPQQTRPSMGPEYILTGAKIGNIHGQNGAGPGSRAIQSFQRPIQRPDNGEGMLFNGRRWFFPFDSSNSSLKNSVDQIPFPCTPIASHEHRQRLNIHSSAARFPGALSEYGRPPLRGLNENTRGGRMADGGKNRRLEVDGNGRVVLDQH